MIYAYRDADESPVPVKLLFGAVEPSSFYAKIGIFMALTETRMNQEKALPIF